MKSPMNVPQPQVGGMIPTMGGSSMPPGAASQKSQPSPQPNLMGRANPMMRGPMERQSMLSNYLRGMPR